MSIESYLKLAAAISAGLVFLIFRRISSGHSGELILRRYEEFSGMLKERQRNSTWYQRTEAKLIKNGAAFHFGRWINPAGYLLLQVLCALTGGFICWVLAPVLGVFGGVLFFFGPEWFLVSFNKGDNNRMLPEIKLIYHALEIQIKAGVYVTDALAECYGSVRQPRLGQALLDLAGQIVMQSDMYDALDCFQKKFDNRHIDALCITILQACESGQAVELLGDIGEQLKDMEAAVMNSKKSSLDRSITFYQLGILVAVMIVIVYACVSYLFSAAVKL
ncbi:MAG: hypothetical protein E7286_05570 [Lachnospiraceae bacterium]|nr:hypothetical protein [Lachnospiraceae bacterium]